MERGHITKAVFSTEIRCAVCGAIMTLVGGKHVPDDLRRQHMDEANADRRSVFVQPCEPCMERELGPARALKAALTEIKGA